MAETARLQMVNANANRAGRDYTANCRVHPDTMDCTAPNAVPVETAHLAIILQVITRYIYTDSFHWYTRLILAVEQASALVAPVTREKRVIPFVRKARSVSIVPRNAIAIHQTALNYVIM